MTQNLSREFLESLELARTAEKKLVDFIQLACAADASERATYEDAGDILVICEFMGLRTLGQVLSRRLYDLAQIGPPGCGAVRRRLPRDPNYDRLISEYQ